MRRFIDDQEVRQQIEAVIKWSINQMKLDEIWLEIRFPVEYSEPRVGQYPIGYLYEPGLKYYVGKMIRADNQYK